MDGRRIQKRVRIIKTIHSSPFSMEQVGRFHFPFSYSSRAKRILANTWNLMTHSPMHNSNNGRIEVESIDTVLDFNSAL